MSLVFADGEWQVPDQFNFARDVVEAVGLHDATWPALTFVDELGAIRGFTFTEMNVLATRWAGLMQDCGLQPGDRVLVQVGTKPDWHAVLLASLRCGAVSVPCPVTLTPGELSRRAVQSSASLLVADRDTERIVEEATNALRDPPTVIYVEDVKARLADYPRLAPCEETYADDLAFIVYTSGVGAEPKGVAHSHACCAAARIHADYWLDARPDDLVWSTSATGWAESVWNGFLGPWSCGSEIVLHEGPFDPRERLELIERLGVTVLCQTPSEYRQLAKLEDIGHHDLSRLHHVVSTGEPLDPALITSFRQAFGITIHDGYGQTESPLLVANAPGSAVRAGSIGRPTPGHDVAVVDESGRQMPPGVEGDIAMRGRPPSLFVTYWDAPEETAARFRGDWYITGDRATVDHDGYFWLKGRVDDMIVSSGYSFGPLEIESALLQDDAVAEAAVIGKPDPYHGQVPKAFVVAQPKAAGGPELAAELEAHWKLMSAPSQHLSEIEFVDSLPKTANGKVRRLELGRLEADRAGSASRASAPEEDRQAGPGDSRKQTGAPPSATESTSGSESTTDSSAPPWVEGQRGESPLVSRLHAYERGDEDEHVDPRAFVVPSPPLDFGEARAARIRKTQRPKREGDDKGDATAPSAESPSAE